MTSTTNIPVGLQLYAVRGEVARDLPTTLRAVAEIGYAGAEPWGYSGASLEWQNHSAQAIRQMYNDNGLICCGIHLNLEALRPDRLATTIEFNQVLGNRFLILAADAAHMASVNGIAELAEILNATAQELAPHGMYCGYHAHGFDFAVVEGEVAWYRLFGQTRPEVIMQIDIGNCAGGGGDPIATLRQFPHRARSVHLEDFGGPTPESVIGEGKANWSEIFRLCETEQNTEWYVVEEGSSNGFGFDIPRRSREALRALGR